MVVSLDTTLWIAGSCGEAIVLGVLVFTRQWRTFPVFSLYVLRALIGDVGAAVILRRHPSAYMGWYLGETILDSGLLFAVLVEVAWSILRPVRASLTRRALIPVIVLILVVGAAVWPFTALPALGGKSVEFHFLFQLEQTVSILQIVFMLALIASSQVLSIGWRDRELQIATGLGFYSAIGVAAAILHTHQTSFAQYKHMDQALIGAWVCTLLYWAISLAQQEAERREFTPEMQRIFLAVAGAAHANRVVLTESQAGRPRQHDQH